MAAAPALLFEIVLATNLRISGKSSRVSRAFLLNPTRGPGHGVLSVSWSVSEDWYKLTPRRAPCLREFE
jgi:hypothetical protein